MLFSGVKFCILCSFTKTEMFISEVIQHNKQEAFEKCWAHSPLRAATLPFTAGVATVARRLRIDVHNDDDDDNNDNDNA